MPKIPRDISGSKLVRLLKKYNYEITRKSGSHVRLTSMHKGKKHNITIPNHKIIKIGTLNNILNDLAGYLEIDKNKLINDLFSSKY